ncbi:MAG TPA: filamentous hemagglutinin N-terminal domain-containing protein, partial [Pseudomonas sp.]|nr:filamentous hemagglutinin N-terminal domain-containing protein [Pseudomonas sp.]
MNHIFRIVWNRVRNAFMVVAENVSGSGRRASGSGRGPVGSVGVFVLGTLAASIFVGSAQASGVEVASGNTQVFQAPNGVQVIDIATANAAGLSHNRYIHYNVDPSGQILNNNSALTRAGALQSQLGGQIVPNVNLTNEARIILNEVVAPNRSSLRGYTEVVGGKADVIVANPNGITCAGCGFINTDRATLTTGTPVIGGNGGLSGFQVRQGDILVEGSGIDGRNQKVLDLVARQVKIDGQLNAQDLQVAAGSNDYDYANRTARAVAPSSDTPLYGIDSTALGGMYANRIQLLATENGVGVRMRGEAAASADDFVLSASGKIEINTKVSAQRDLAVTYNGSAVPSDAIAMSGSGTQLHAGRDLAVKSHNSAGVSVSESNLTSGRNLAVEAGTVKLSQGSNLYAGVDEQASDHGLSIKTTAGELELTQASVQSTGTLSLDAASALRTDAASEIKSQGDFALKAGAAVVHAGKLQGAAKGRIEAGGDLTNSNLIHAADDLQVSATNITNTNTAGLSSLKQLTLEARNNLDNAGALYAGEQMQLDAGGTLRNRASGTLDSNGDITTASAHFVNNGAVVAQGDLSITARQSFTNETIWAGGSLTKEDGEVTHGRVLSENKIANEGSFDAGMNVWMYDELFTYDEQLVGLTMAELQALQKAQLLAVGADSKLTISYGNSGLNKVGVISAPTVEIGGSGVFRNEELALYSYEKVLRWIRIDDESSGDDDFVAWARVHPDQAYLPSDDPDDDSNNWDNWN